VDRCVCACARVCVCACVRVCVCARCCSKYYNYLFRGDVGDNIYSFFQKKIKRFDKIPSEIIFVTTTLVMAVHQKVRCCRNNVLT